MKVKQTLAAAGIITTLGLGGVAGTQLVGAETNSGDPASNLVQKIATKFNLNKDEVQTVFDQEKTERDSERKKNLDEELSKLVSGGKITEDQKQKIITKRKELQKQRETNRDTMKDKTQEERKTAMESGRDSLTQWLKDNGISEDYARYVGGHGGGPGGPGRPGRE